jgi:hypothetical protein
MPMVGSALVATLWAGAARVRADDEETRVRWDIINLINGATSPGGVAAARANDDSKITITGTGTFEGTSGEAKGGGTWMVCNKAATVCASGTFRVRRLVRFERAPGTPPPVIDGIDHGEPTAGLAVLSIAYSDGEKGILVVSCHFVGTPDSVFEGITASKGFVDFWNRETPAPGVNADRTVFHVTREDDD